MMVRDLRRKLEELPADAIVSVEVHHCLYNIVGVDDHLGTLTDGSGRSWVRLITPQSEHSGVIEL